MLEAVFEPANIWQAHDLSSGTRHHCGVHHCRDNLQLLAGRRCRAYKGSTERSTGREQGSQHPTLSRWHHTTGQIHARVHSTLKCKHACTARSKQDANVIFHHMPTPPSRRNRTNRRENALDSSRAADVTNHQHKQVAA